MTDFAVPAEFETYAEQMDQIASALVHYLELSPTWSADSPAAVEIAAESSVSPLGFERPVLAALTRINQCLSFAHDHLVAGAAILRTPRTVLALHTVARTLLISSAQGFYLADPDADVRERVRRAMNIQLGTWAEIMNLAGVGATEYDRAVDSRKKVLVDGRTLGFKVAKTDRKSGFVDPRDWFLAPKPPSDMALLDDVLNAGPGAHFGQSMFRVLSAFAHGQLHSVLMLAGDASNAPMTSDGVREVPIPLGETQLLMLLVSIAAVLEVTQGRAARLFGWSQLRWNSLATPVFLGWGQRFREITADD